VGDVQKVKLYGIRVFGLQVFLLQHQFKLQVAGFQEVLANTLIKNTTLLVEECAWFKFDNPSGNGLSGQSSNFERFLVVSCNTQHGAPSQTNYLGLHALYPLCRSSDFVAFSMAELMPPSIRETLLDPNSEHVSDITKRLQQWLGRGCPLDLQGLIERDAADDMKMDDDDETDDDEKDGGAVAHDTLLKIRHSKSRPNTYFSEMSKVKLTMETSHVGTGEEAAMVRSALD
jgi:hypothetical protein